MPEDHEVSRARKRAKKENSLKHGVYSREVMLPGENIRCYETLVAETTEEWAPEGATERSLVDRLVGLFWRRQRLERYEQSKLQERIKETYERPDMKRAHQRWIEVDATLPVDSLALLVQAHVHNVIAFADRAPLRKLFVCELGCGCTPDKQVIAEEAK